MTDTSFEYRRHFEEGIPVREGLRTATITISNKHLGDEEVLLHEVAHVITRGRHGPDIRVHGKEFLDIEATLLKAFSD